MKCDVCDEEFDTENQLLQHKALMHAGESTQAGMSERDDDLEEPDFPKAANE